MQWRPEELDQRVRFNKIVNVKDSVGGQTKTFVKNFDCWAKAKAKSGNERSEKDMLEATGNYQFIIRNRTDFDETNQIIWNGDAYNIKFIQKLGGRQLYLAIDAERGVAQ